VRLHLVTAEDQLTLELRARELIRFPQLTMPLLAALTPLSWSVTHTDEITRAVDAAQRWDVVGITAATPGAPHAYDLAQEFRANGARVVMGGPHATLLPYEAAQHVDIVVAGEAESVWPRVLRDIEHETRYATGRHLLDVRTGANVEVLPAGSRIYRCPTPATLAGLPPARRDSIHHGGWNKWWATRAPTIATRGCPHSCDYCAIPLVYPQARSMRFRPVEEVVAEVGRVPDKGIVFWDDNIAASPRYAKALFRALGPLRKWWTSQATMASLQDDELLTLAAASGCRALFVGLESISQASLAGVGKGHNRVADYASLLQRLHAHGIALQAGIMFGFDGDDPDIFARTVDAFGKLGLDNATISLVVPYPGTPVYRRLRAEGRILDDDWRHYNGKTHVVYRPSRMSPDTLMREYEWAKREFYSPGHILRRMGISRTGLWWNVPRNLGYMFGTASEADARAAEDPPPRQPQRFPVGGS
jgi:radical SAM superfamily enzyme YgiQ (UPF0313 family)